ncbi:hypothetical protein F5144DRAFT_559849 [Chaetomium tenue]|uniref:Uncharacterized protein n=1 Tax=Chaetomium tenue TaxID=1854479 RepID=A0ACB7PEM8_9PEZI|nr:hypothetical protein F5144DRAFT_559849 [Chaetomium globosum]
MAGTLNLSNPRCSKRPRQGDYDFGTGLDNTSGAPKTFPDDSINPSLTMSNPYGDAPSADPPQSDSLSNYNMNGAETTLFSWDIGLQYLSPPDTDTAGLTTPGVAINSSDNHFWMSPGTTESSNPSFGTSALPGGPLLSQPSMARNSGDPPLQQPRASREGPSEQEWEERRPLIQFLYAPDKPNLNLTLQELMQVMEKAGFLKGATRNMYNNRFAKWDIVKNESNAQRRQRAQRQVGTSMKAKVTFKGMLDNIRAICEASIAERRSDIWALDDEFRIIDDDWENAYGSAAALVVELSKNPDSPTGWETIRGEVAAMVRALNYFSLPTILIIAFRMCKLENARVRSKTAGDFLRGCCDLARAEAAASARHAPLVKLLQGLYDVSQSDMDCLADMLELTIPFYIQLVNTYGMPESASALSLVAFYNVVLGSGPLWLESTLAKIQRLLKRAEAEKGEDDMATIEIMGLALFVLQQTDQVKTLRRLSAQMRIRITRRMRRAFADEQERMYFVNRLLDGIHLEIRLARDDVDEDTKGLVADLEKEYRELQESYGKEEDSYGKILELELEDVRAKLQGTSL